MKHLDLFAGIGGFSLAARWMGWKTVAQVEWDKWCQKVLAKNFPDALRFGDIVEFNKMLEDGKIIGYTEGAEKTEIREVFREGQGHKQSTDTIGVDTIAERRTGCVSIGHIDIITGGFPCQPFSHAGKRKGTDDSRYLWPAMLETIRRIKPAYVVGENVAGLVSMENSKTLDRILYDLEDEGYTTEQVIIPACAVGAWHRRDRIWIIAYKSIQGLQGSRQKSRESKIQQENRIKQLCGNVPDSKKQRTQGIRRLRKQVTEENVRQRLSVCSDRDRTSSDWWESEPSVGRVANGIPNRVDRLKGLGNAIVPQVAYEIFKAIEQYNEVLNNQL